VGLLPVYAASEEQPDGVDSGLIATELRDRGLRDVTLLSGHEAIAGWLDDVADSKCLLLTLGAGDVGRQVSGICDHLDRRTLA